MQIRDSLQGFNFNVELYTIYISALLSFIPTYLHTYIPTYLHTNIPTYLHTYLPTYYLPTTYLLPTYLPAYLPTCLTCLG